MLIIEEMKSNVPFFSPFVVKNLFTALKNTIHQAISYVGIPTEENMVTRLPDSFFWIVSTKVHERHSNLTELKKK